MNDTVKGIILAGGAGTRLYPLTMVTSKQLLPIYDKPMIYYPLSTLMLAGIKDILIISTPTDLPNFERLLGDGSEYGVTLSYKVQPSPDGLAQAFLLGEEFIGDDACAMVLGDNIFYGNGFGRTLRAATANAEQNGRATVFGYYVNDPERFGIVEFDANGKAISLEEKPKVPKNNQASMGIYIFDTDVLVRYLESDAKDENSANDFGKNIIPTLISSGERVFCYPFSGYWKDVGTIASLWDANMDLLGERPAFDLHDRHFRIYSRNKARPPQKIGEGAKIVNSLISEGCVIEGTVVNSVLSGGVYVAKGAEVRDSVIMDDVQIESGARVAYSIIDSDTVIGECVSLGDEGGSRENIRVIAKGSVLQAT